MGLDVVKAGVSPSPNGISVVIGGGVQEVAIEGLVGCGFCAGMSSPSKHLSVDLDVSKVYVEAVRPRDKGVTLVA